MIEKNYADYAWEQTDALLAIDSPSGYTAQAAAWVRDAFASLGFYARITTKGAFSSIWAVKMKPTVCCWRPTPIPWALWWPRSRGMAA